MTNFYSRRARVSRVRKARVRRSYYRAKATASRVRVNEHNAKVSAFWENMSSPRKYYNFGRGVKSTSLCRAVIELKKVTDESIPWSDDQNPRDLRLHHSMLIELRDSMMYESLFIKTGDKVSDHHPRRIFHMGFGGLVNFLEEKKDNSGPFKFLEKNEIEIKLNDIKNESRISDSFCFIIPCKSSFSITTIDKFDRKKLPKDLHERTLISSYDPKNPKEKKEGDNTKRSPIIFCILFRENYNNKILWRVMGIPAKLGLEEVFEDLYVTDDQPPRYEKTIQRILSIVDENEALQKRFLQSFERVDKETKEITDKYELEYVKYFKDLGKRKKGRIHLKCRAEELDKMDRLLGLSDPYFRIRVDGSEDEGNWYYKSEVIKRDLEPHWKAATCKKKVRKLNRRHRLEVMDWNKIGKDQLIGYFTFIPQKVFKKNQKMGGSFYSRKKSVRFYISRVKDLSITKNKYLRSGIFFFDQFIIFGGKNVKREDVVRKFGELETLKEPYEEAKGIGRRIRFKNVSIGEGEKKEEQKEEEEEGEGEGEQTQQDIEEDKKGDDVPEEESEESDEDEESDFDSTDSSAKEESD